MIDTSLITILDFSFRKNSGHVSPFRSSDWIRKNSPAFAPRSHRTTTRSRLAVLPVGYADGYDRALSNLAYVLIKGRRAPVRGRVCMNMIVVDVTDIPGVRPEDEAVLLGAQGSDTVTAEEFAGWIGTINYEAVTRVNPMIERVIVA